MTYRGYKRLLGESSLERKSRLLLGTMTLLLISGSFYLYAWLTVQQSYETTMNAGRLLAGQILYDFHVLNDKAKRALADFQEEVERHGPPALQEYHHRLYKPHSNEPRVKFDANEREIIERFKNDPNHWEEPRHDKEGRKFYYYYGVRTSTRCLECHPTEKDKTELRSIRDGQLYGVVRIQLDARAIEEGVHLHRAILISCALITALLIMAGSYLIVRYVVVKPVKHLKEVSDSIANGYYNVRSEIQTGDEFEDLSVAFNRMIRNLLTKQEELNEAKGELSSKVDELAHANLALFESNRLKDDFLATMSHELRTPLHSILGFSELLEQGDNLSDKQHRWANNIRASGSELLDLINDVLDLAKIEAGKMAVRPESFSAGALAERVAEQFRPLAEKKQIDLRTEVPIGLPLVRQDQGKLLQILANLLSNAVKFTPDGGRVLVGVAIENADLVFTVSDTGVGISGADQETVFEKFRQGANPLTREHAGTGLGLSIVRELANLLGGEVEVESEPGQGSTFTVRVPKSTGPNLEVEGDAELSKEEPAHNGDGQRQAGSHQKYDLG